MSTFENEKQVDHYQVSVDVDGDGRVVLTLWDHSSDSPNPQHVVLSPDAAAELAQALTRDAFRAAKTVAEALELGDCPTCRNVRLVAVENRHGSTVREYCPDCNEGGRSRRAVVYPRIGGGVR